MMTAMMMQLCEEDSLGGEGRRPVQGRIQREKEGRNDQTIHRYQQVIKTLTVKLKIIFDKTLQRLLIFVEICKKEGLNFVDFFMNC